MTIDSLGIIGVGNVGRAVARRAVDVGIPVILSNSRGPGSLHDFVAELGDLCRAASPAEAARSGSLIVAAIPLHAYQQLPVDELAGKTVMDTMNYVVSDAWRVTELDTNDLTSSELVQRYLQYSRVVKVLNNFVPHHLHSLARPRSALDRTAMPISGDDAAAKAGVAELLDAFGFDAVDIGDLAGSWRSEPNSPVYVAPYLPSVPTALTLEELAAWVATAPGVPASSTTIRQLVAAAVRGPAGFRI